MEESNAVDHRFIPHLIRAVWLASQAQLKATKLIFFYLHLCRWLPRLRQRKEREFVPQLLLIVLYRPEIRWYLLKGDCGGLIPCTLLRAIQGKFRCLSWPKEETHTDSQDPEKVACWLFMQVVDLFQVAPASSLILRSNPNAQYLHTSRILSLPITVVYGIAYRRLPSFIVSSRTGTQCESRKRFLRWPHRVVVASLSFSFFLSFLLCLQHHNIKKGTLSFFRLLKEEPCLSRASTHHPTLPTYPQ